MALDNALKYAVGYWPYAMNALGDGKGLPPTQRVD